MNFIPKRAVNQGSTVFPTYLKLRTIKGAIRLLKQRTIKRAIRN